MRDVSIQNVRDGAGQKNQLRSVSTVNTPFDPIANPLPVTQLKTGLDPARTAG